MVTPWDMQRRLFRFMKAQETPMTLVSIQDVRTFGAQEATGATDHTYYFEFAVGGGRYKMRVDHSDIALLKYKGGRAERGPCLLRVTGGTKEGRCVLEIMEIGTLRAFQRPTGVPRRL